MNNLDYNPDEPDIRLKEEQSINPYYDAWSDPNFETNTAFGKYVRAPYYKLKSKINSTRLGRNILNSSGFNSGYEGVTVPDVIDGISPLLAPYAYVKPTIGTIALAKNPAVYLKNISNNLKRIGSIVGINAAMSPLENSSDVLNYGSYGVDGAIATSMADDARKYLKLAKKVR